MIAEQLNQRTAGRQLRPDDTVIAPSFANRSTLRLIVELQIGSDFSCEKRMEAGIAKALRRLGRKATEKAVIIDQPPYLCFVTQVSLGNCQHRDPRRKDRPMRDQRAHPVA